MANQLSISKSKYLAGLQCHKLLWFYYNAKDEIPMANAAKYVYFFGDGKAEGKAEMKDCSAFPSGTVDKSAYGKMGRVVLSVGGVLERGAGEPAGALPRDR